MPNREIFFFLPCGALLFSIDEKSNQKNLARSKKNARKRHIYCVFSILVPSQWEKNI